MAADYTDYELYHEWLSLNRPATEEERHIGGVAASTPAHDAIGTHQAGMVRLAVRRVIWPGACS